MSQARVAPAGGPVAAVADRVGSSTRTFGRTVRLGVRAAAIVATDSARLRFPVRETLVQAWSFAAVALLPAIGISVPMGVVIAVQVGSITDNVGAASMAGAVGGMGVMQQIAPLAAALWWAVPVPRQSAPISDRAIRYGRRGGTDCGGRLTAPGTGLR
ncbi:ABC transporter permease [Nocardia sp. NPDC050193]